MSSGTVSIIMCDDESGCTEWFLDHYTMGVTNWQQFIPAGWQYDPYRRNLDDLCPDHAPTTVPVVQVLTDYTTGDGTKWDTEFDYLRTDPVQRDILDELRRSIRDHGQLEPILLGTDGRVWDGHHRLCVLLDQGEPNVKVVYA